MANEVELERIIVRLIGDGSSFQKMMTEAAATTRTMTNRMYTALSRVERFAGTLVRGLGSFGLASSLRSMFHQFSDLEQGQIRLNAAIRGGGHDAEQLVARYTRVAESIAAATLNTKGHVLSLFQEAEANQLSGQAAEDAVRYAVALAGATGQSADAMMRTAIQLQRGHPEFAKRILNLRDVKDETELVNKIMEKMNTGMQIATAEFNSANGRIERLGRSLKGIGTDIGGMISKVLLPVVGMLQQAFEAFKRLDPEIKEQTALIVGLTIAWLGMGPVTQVLKDLLTPTFQLVRFLTISLPLTVANAAAWLIWKTILGLAAIVVFTLAGFIWLANGATISWATAVAIVSAAQMVWKGVIWLVNGALAVMWTLLAPATLLAIVATVVVLGGAFFTLYTAISSIVSVFKNITGLAGPLGAITNMLGEWWQKIKEIFNTAQTDLPRAWNMLKAGFDLAISQIKDLWMPLWDFIQGGFSLIWEAVSEMFIAKMTTATRAVMRLMLPLAPGLAGALDALDRNQPGEAFFINRMRRDLLALSAGFNVVESEATRTARGAYNALRPVGGAANGAVPGLNRLETAMRGVRQEAQRFDAALFGSAEAMTRIAEQADRISVGRVAASATPSLSASAATATAIAGAVGGLGIGPVVQLLGDIKTILANKNVIQLQAAGLGGA